MRVMITDDEPYIVKGLAAIIRELKTPFTELAESYDGFEALEKMPDFKPDLLITDIKMPEMDGFELIRRSREAGLCRRFVILTGFSEFEYARKAVRSQVIDYLLKTVQRSELEVLLNKIAKRISEERAAGAGAGNLNGSGSVNGSCGVSGSGGVSESGGTGGVSESDGANELFSLDNRSDLMRKALDYIHLHYASSITLDAVSQEIWMHPNYFSSFFKREMGITYHNYLTKYRVEKSKQILTGGRSISETASMTGFADKRHFFKVFKKVTGMTPGQYREKSTY